MNPKFYCLFANGHLYDSHDSLETVQKWFNGFSASLTKKQSPHRWFNRFFVGGKMTPIHMEIRSFTVSVGKVIEEQRY